MGLLAAVYDHDRVLYFLTLGVLEGHRHRGIASTLVARACQHAVDSRCVCVGGGVSCDRLCTIPRCNIGYGRVSRLADRLANCPPCCSTTTVATHPLGASGAAQCSCTSSPTTQQL